MALQSITALATITLQEDSSSVTFSSIPATFRDVIVRGSGAASLSAPSFDINVNSDTGSNYAYVYMLGDGTNDLSGSGTDTRAYAGQWGTNQSSCYIQFIDYSATDKHKTILAQAGDAGSRVDAFANRWADTAAINTIKISLSSGTFVSGSTFALFGRIA